MGKRKVVSLAEVAQHAWQSADVFEFGRKLSWDADTFTKEWLERNGRKWTGNQPGWYWFSCIMDYETLRDQKRPKTLPAKGRDIGRVVQENLKIFNLGHLCKADESGCVVLYNGQDQRVMSRIRAHFNVGNDKTGALGLKHYPLSNLDWRVHIFTVNHLGDFSADVRKQVELLIKSKIVRCAIESAWRVQSGWPILCKA